MSEKMSEKVRLGKREKELINFLENHGGMAWYSDIKDEFVWAIGYTKILRERLYRLEKKGLIKLEYREYPRTKRKRLVVILLRGTVIYHFENLLKPELELLRSKSS